MGRTSRLIVVANRGPYGSVEKGGKRRLVRSAGGLVTALDPVLRARGGVWVSTSQTDTPHVVDIKDSRLEYELASVELSRPVVKGFYQGVSNAVLWPTLHSLPPTIRIGQAPWPSYEKANRTFAERIREHARDGDVVWVQDFHLTLVPRMLREAGPKVRIGWFCHVPWPGPDLFAILPWRTQILEGLLGADLLGFHTEAYALNFLHCVEQLAGLEVDTRRMTVRYQGRTVRVVAAPIGVPVNEIQHIASDAAVAQRAGELQESLGGRRIILGVDRLDYTKGIPERILAFEQLLKRDRTARKRCTLVQIMVPSRTDVRAYADLKAEVDRMVGDINGRFSTTGQAAIHYLFRSLNQHQLYAHYLAADVALVTPLRDGMNLVAQEYVACRMNDDGALVLSEFAGAAQYLQEALRVNPYDIHALADTLQQALSLEPTKAARRMRALRQRVSKLDVHRWASDYLSLLEAS